MVHAVILEKIRNYYIIARNFHMVQFSWMVNLYHFAGSILVDVRAHSHYVLYN